MMKGYMMKRLIRKIPVFLLVCLMLSGCIRIFGGVKTGEFVVDEQGNVHFVTDERKKKQEKEEREDVQEPAALQEVAVVETEKGTIVFRFFPDDAPQTVENFRKLTADGFYDGLKFHRVDAGYVIQGGDPAGNGLGGPGYTIPAEFNARPHLEGTVGMARGSDPNSAGSQFYICLDALPQLDGKYTVFGQVVEGLEVVHQIERGDVMKKITLESRQTAF